MEQYGNTETFNIENVIVQNVKTSLYYVKYAVDLDTPYDLIDEIFEKVDHVEPWMSGNARGASTAFCLLYRLGQLKPDTLVLREMLDHRDSPYIRAIGFLYLRYCCDPRDLWKWFKKYVSDEKVFKPSPQHLGKDITIGEFVREILLDQYYFETIFPRIPKSVNDEIVDALRRMGFATQPVGNAGQGGPSRRGGESKRPASVKASLSVALGQRAPNRSGVREDGRGLDSDMVLEERNHGRWRDSRDRSPRWDEDKKRRQEDGRSRVRSRSRDHHRYDQIRHHREYHDDLSRRRGEPPSRRDDSRRHLSDARHPSPPKRDVREVFKERPVKSIRGNLSRY